MIDLPTALSAAHARGRSAVHSRVYRNGQRKPINGVYPKGMEPKPLDGVVLGIKPAPIDNDTHADCVILLAIIAKTQPHRVAEFFALTGDRHEKMAFLLKYGHFDLAGGKQ